MGLNEKPRLGAGAWGRGSGGILGAGAATGHSGAYRPGLRAWCWGARPSPGAASLGIAARPSTQPPGHRPRPDRRAIASALGGWLPARLAKLAPTRRGPWPGLANAIGPGITVLRNKPELAERIKNLGKSLNVWTVDRGEDIELCKDLGVDILITNTPAHARTFL